MVAVSVLTVIFVAVILRGKVGSHNVLLLCRNFMCNDAFQFTPGAYRSSLTAVSQFYYTNSFSCSESSEKHVVAYFLRAL